MNAILNIVSPKGKYNRKEYAIYGMLIPLGLLALALINIHPILTGTLLLLSIVVLVFSSVKRARDTKYNTVTMIVLFFLPYVSLVVLLVLLFAPHGEKVSSKSSKVLMIVVIGFVVVILGILAAVAIPKLAAVQQEAKAVTPQSQLQ